MPYSTNVDVINLEGGSYPSATGRIWMLWTVVGTGSGTGPQQQEEGSDTVQSTSSSFPLSFARGPDFQYASRGIGISIQDSNRVGDDTGWWFRSGRLEVLPNERIEVVLANAVEFTQADLDASLPQMPMVVDPQTTITSVTAMLRADGFIDLVANGTTTSAGPPVTFTYTLMFKVVPSASIAQAETEVFEIATPDRGSIVFAPGPGGGVTAAFLNALNFFVLREIFPRFKTRLKDGINSAVISQIANMIAPGTTTLPSGVVVSARSVHGNASRISVRAALGAFGGVIAKFPQTGTGGGRKICTILTIGASTLGALQPDVFRLFRDNILPSSSGGKELKKLYYRHSPEAVKILTANPALFRRAGVMLLKVQKALLSSSKIDKETAKGCRELLSDISRNASLNFRNDVAKAISIAQEERYFGLFDLGATNLFHLEVA